MPTYDRSCKEIMREYAAQNIKPGQVFGKDQVLAWFRQNYPNLKESTVAMHILGFCTNLPNHRKHHPTIRPNSGWDLFYRVDHDRYRLWNAESDPRPLYGTDSIEYDASSADEQLSIKAENKEEATNSFAYEEDLRNYLARNLYLLEDGLHLYTDGNLSGLEYPAGGKFIDILAQDSQGNFVVIELKVSSGTYSALGQVLYYIGWIRENLADGKSVRGMIVTRNATKDLLTALSAVTGVNVFSYSLSVSVSKVQ